MKTFLHFWIFFFIFLYLWHTSAASDLECTRPNEEYQCGSACQTTCATLGEPCPIVNIKCNDACYCKDDYARNEDGVCVPISECSNS